VITPAYNAVIAALECIKANAGQDGYRTPHEQAMLILGYLEIAGVPPVAHKLTQAQKQRLQRKVEEVWHRDEERLRDWQDIAQGYKEGASQ
jgi:hypothetical protein